MEFTILTPEESAKLQEMRKKAGLTGKDVENMGWCKASTVVRSENSKKVRVDILAKLRKKYTFYIKNKP